MASGDEFFLNAAGGAFRNILGDGFSELADEGDFLKGCFLNH